MKKALSGIVLFCLLFACIGAQALTNPYTALSSLEEINETLGCQLSRPAVMGVSEESFGLLHMDERDDIGEYNFTVNGLPYCFRFSADFETDISGVYIDAAPAFTGPAGSMDYAADPSYKLARWSNVDGQYTLTVEDHGAMTQDQFEGIAMEIRSSSMPMDSSDFPVGTYCDTYSNRATAEVMGTENGYFITVCWASSAFESTYWTMTASPDGKGRLTYTDGTTFTLTVDEDMNETISDYSENLAGYFEIAGDTLAWTGAADEQCRLCSFVPAEQAE